MERIQIPCSGTVSDSCPEQCPLLRQIPIEERVAFLAECAARGAFISCPSPANGQGNKICRLSNDSKQKVGACQKIWLQATATEVAPVIFPEIDRV